MVQGSSTECVAWGCSTESTACRCSNKCAVWVCSTEQQCKECSIECAVLRRQVHGAGMHHVHGPGMQHQALDAGMLQGHGGGMQHREQGTVQAMQHQIQARSAGMQHQAHSVRTQHTEHRTGMQVSTQPKVAAPHAPCVDAARSARWHWVPECRTTCVVQGCIERMVLGCAMVLGASWCWDASNTHSAGMH